MKPVTSKIGELMLKVFIVGYDEPHSVVGKFLFEDERFLYLDDGGKKIKIPQRRVAYIEDWTELEITENKDVAPSRAATQTPFVVSKGQKSQEMFSNEPLTPQQIQNKLAEAGPEDATKIGEQLKQMLSQRLAEQQRNALRSSQIEPDEFDQPLPINLSGDTTSLLLLFTGAKEGQYPLIVPTELFDGHYTPALAREIFRVPDVQAFMSSDIILDGLPLIKGTTVQFKTKTAKTVGDVTAKMDVLGKMLSVGAGATLNPAPRTSPFDSGFSMPDSPFKTLPTILGKPKDEVKD